MQPSRAAEGMQRDAAGPVPPSMRSRRPAVLRSYVSTGERRLVCVRAGPSPSIRWLGREIRELLCLQNRNVRVRVGPEGALGS